MCIRDSFRTARTALPFWGQINSNPRDLSPKREFGSERINCRTAVPFWRELDPDSRWICPQNGRAVLKGIILEPLEPHSRFGDKSTIIHVIFPQNGSAVLKGLILEPQSRFGDKLTLIPGEFVPKRESGSERINFRTARTALPFWGQINSNPSDLSSGREFGSERINFRTAVPFWRQIDPDSRWIRPQDGRAVLKGIILEPLEPHSCFGDKSTIIHMICPQNGSAVLEGLILEPQSRFGDKLTLITSEFVPKTGARFWKE